MRAASKTNRDDVSRRTRQFGTGEGMQQTRVSPAISEKNRDGSTEPMRVFRHRIVPV
jgi:hypothetical protein